VTHEVVGRVEELGVELAGLADENESLGKLSTLLSDSLRDHFGPKR
jgi:3-hydroxy-9,10-secoandrosta-1,3,5(10)-triene-9,17-dione monooxygenase